MVKKSWQQSEWVRVLHPARQIIGHFGFAVVLTTKNKHQKIPQKHQTNKQTITTVQMTSNGWDWGWQQRKTEWWHRLTQHANVLWHSITNVYLQADTTNTNGMIPGTRRPEEWYKDGWHMLRHGQQKMSWKEQPQHHKTICYTAIDLLSWKR